MLKKRLVFCLLYSSGQFCLSRNFRLQKVGDITWLRKNYNFSDIAKSIDELIILDVGRGVRDKSEFCRVVSQITEDCFIPFVLGGGINNIDDASILISHGADKIIVNSLAANDPSSIKNLVKIYGSQSIVASVDYRMVEGEARAYSDQGKSLINGSLKEYLYRVRDLGVGEIFLNSIDRDGSGQGIRLDLVGEIVGDLSLPIVVAGGAGNQFHLKEALEFPGIDGVATANLFNFVGDGLPIARRYLLGYGIDLAEWQY